MFTQTIRDHLKLATSSTAKSYAASMVTLNLNAQLNRLENFANTSVGSCVYYNALLLFILNSFLHNQVHNYTFHFDHLGCRRT